MTKLLLKKPGFPEEGEFVLCTVNEIHYHSVFVMLDEYQKVGLIHISEIAPGRIRNLRDYVVENKKIVCQVLGVNKEKGHIDLSLRRVNERQRRAKINEIKQEQIAEKIIEMVAMQLKLEPEKLYNEIYEKAIKRYSSLYHCFEEEGIKGNAISTLGLPEDIFQNLSEQIKQRIKRSLVKISGDLKLTSYKPNGIEIIKNALLKILEMGNDSVKLRYNGGGRYHLDVFADDYKEAEKLLEMAISYAKEEMTKNSSFMDFQRAE